jgi:hypothetical protein
LTATNGRLNPHCIDFIPDKEYENECAAFEDLLYEELQLRQMDASGDMEDTRERLYERLKCENELESSIDTIVHFSKNLQALVPTTKSMPYILHSEPRIAIKILTMIFWIGIDNHDSKKEQEVFCEKLSSLVNKKVLETNRNPAQWVVPVTEKKKENEDYTGRIKIGDLRLQGPQLRKFMVKIDIVIK